MPDPSIEDIAEMRTDLKWIRSKLETQCSWQTRTETRIGSLENWRSFLAGGFGLLALLIGWGLMIPEV